MRIAAWIVAAGLVVGCSASVVSAQVTDDTAAAAKQLADALASQTEGPGPRFIAANDPSGPNRFVAAMLIPNVQLLVIAADYRVPMLLRERLLTAKYRDAYQDLSSATKESSRLTIDDVQADGLALKPGRGRAGDLLVHGDREVRFDGRWRDQKIKEDAYKAAFADARKEYLRLVGLLVAQATRQP